jgi:hypothetical protein
MNNNTILQIPISKSLRDEAQAQAIASGFSSLQEYVRVHLTQFKNSVLNFSMEPKPIKLSAKNAKRYDKMTDDILSGKVKLRSADSVDELMRQLSQ